MKKRGSKKGAGTQSVHIQFNHINIMGEPRGDTKAATVTASNASLSQRNSKYRPGRILPINLRTMDAAESDNMANLELSPKKGEINPQRRREHRPSFKGHSSRRSLSDSSNSEQGSTSSTNSAQNDSLLSTSTNASTNGSVNNAASNGNIVDNGAANSAIEDSYAEDSTFSRGASVQRKPSSSERILELRGPGKRAWNLPSSGPRGSNGPSMFVRRLQKTRERQSAKAQEESELGLRELQQTFATRSASSSENWEFWTLVVGDYDNVARTQPAKLKQAIQTGFPSELRSLLWQVISSSKSTALEQLYGELIKTADAPAAAAISKDLDRTPMAKNVDRDALARLLLAYSLFDPEVGYTQGMAFIAVPLLMEMSETEAFGLFVQLMKSYDFRTVFMTEMPGLHLKLYQFDRMLEDTLESVHTHLRREGVQSSMYASQWFLTMFAYRFPPSLVTRIFDIVIAEGMEALLRFAFALMQATAPAILQLHGLDQLLPFLKEQIFDKFDGNENGLVKLASNVELLPQIMSKYELEYVELNRLEKERMEQMDTLRASNARLTLQNKQLESSLEALNVEHIEIANKMVTTSMELALLRDENHELNEKLHAVSQNHEVLGELTTRLMARDTELARLKRQNESMQQELALLRKTQGIADTSKLVSDNDRLREMNNRYELQLGSLQESLASAMEGN